ncbi:MAG: 1,6-anhydro-N-acetylmuramyl-L-alanine amidase AmpD [Gammaproteobacteria bacterium]|nr:1,6-anhydro-N-acetylmuramyl-L-alanine amidase AmpD [Gammaproteobacteria bacterium]
MQIDPDTGLLDNARHVLSPNCDDRPADSTIDLLVVHNISLPPNEFGGPYIEQLFTNCLNPDEHAYFRDICQLKVASHLLIRRNGEIIQFVPFHKRAWHAGESRFEDRERCNDFSIGIELEGADDIPYEDVQYEKLVEISQLIFKTYPDMSKDRVAGHSEIAPGRKTDPGPAFDWERYRSQLAKRV